MLPVFGALFARVFRYTESLSTRTAGRGILRRRLLQLQPTTSDGLLRCMLLGVELPKENVIGAHIFKHAWLDLTRYVLDFDDIDDPRNGLLLYKPLEWAFDTSRMAIVWDAGSGGFVARILDNRICGIYLYQKAKELLKTKYKEAACFTGCMTFGDVDGRRLVLPHEFSPYRRCLMFQALCARRHAQTEGWMHPGSFAFGEFWSDASEDIATKVRNWLNMSDFPACFPADNSSDATESSAPG